MRESRTWTLGSDLMIAGEIRGHGEILLDGQVHGDLRCTSVILGENSRLEGVVVAEDVVVRGRVVGSLHADRVTLKSNAHVEGDIFYRILAIEEGAFFEGSSHSSEVPSAQNGHQATTRSVGGSEP